MRRNLLFYCMVIFDACVMAGAVYAYKLGYLKLIFTSDKTGICFAIAGLFLVGVVSALWRAYVVSRTINEHKAAGSYRGFFKERAAERLEAQQDHIFEIGELLALLALIGTAIGLYTIFLGGGGDEQIRAGIATGALIAFPASILGLSCMMIIRVKFAMLNMAVSLHKIEVRHATP